MAFFSGNRRKTSGGSGISLFPFLAVLLCTMGAMIAILLLMARMAQQNSEEYVQGVLQQQNPVSTEELAEETGISEEELEKLRSFLEMERWRLEQLQQVRAEKQQAMRQSRMAMSSALEEQKRLAEKIEHLREALKKMETQEQKGLPKHLLKQQIAEKELELEKLQKALATAENQMKERDGSYAILPHEGKNGTRRYPIYLECREDGVWLMPENIHLGARDFEGVLSLGNPLEAALMAKRNYLLQQGIFQETPDGEQEPYPLIVVRPKGIVYLYMVRSALQSWKSEFGFELAEADWKLAYPPQDAALAKTMQQAIGTARVRQEQLAAMAPTISELSGGGSSAGNGLVYRPTSQGPQAMAVDQNSRLARTLRNSARQQEALLKNAAPPPFFAPPVQPAQPQRAMGKQAVSPIEEDLSLWEPVEEKGNPAEKRSDETKRSPFEGHSTLRSLAESQGQNWALDHYRPSMTSLSRTVPMECHADCYVLLTPPDEEDVVVPIFSPTESVRLLASRIRERVRKWGEPGTGMYWKPVLKVRVLPGAEAQLERLQKLLENSGLEIEIE
ncbi:MAG: hypothetical protein Q4E67_06055 [Planctomycetia bacterium]|nr:hypothetical protein [Planctomycetia bacterium]